MASRIIASIPSALDHLQWLQDFFYCYDVEKNKLIRILIHKIRALKTFVLCSTKFHDNGHMTTEDNNDSTNTGLGSLLLRIERLVCRSTEDDLSRDGWNKVSNLLIDIELFEDEIDKGYISFLECLQQSSSPVLNQVSDIADSVLENLDDFLSFHRAYVGVLIGPIEALKENITFLRIFIRFTTLLCPESHDQSHDILKQIEALAFSAAHLTAHLFSASHYNFQVFSADIFADTESSKRNTSYGGLKSMISSLLLRINPVDNPLIYEAYSKSLSCLKYSRDLYVPTLNTSGDPVNIMEDFIAFLISTLYDALLLDKSHVVELRDPLQALYEGLRSLRTILKKQRNKYDHKIMDMTAAAICDAGVMIFSLDKIGSVINLRLPSLLEKINNIRTEVGEQVVKVMKFGLPKTNILGFLDFLLDYLAGVKSSNVISDVQSCVLKIREDLVFLRSFMDILLELRNQQEDIHQALWDLSVEVVYKIEILIDQLVLGNIQDSLFASFQSIIEDIKIIRGNSLEILCDMKQEIKVQEVTRTSPLVPSQMTQIRSSTSDEVVGFEIERSSIIDRLIRGTRKLQVVAVVGMPGSGKTTLATQVYNDPSVSHHFHVRAWCSVTHVFLRRKVQLELLNHIQGKVPDKNMSEEDLSQELWRSLKRRRYLIFLDDIWDAQAFDRLKESLPDDCTESRILLTSRHCDAVIADEKPHLLREFTVTECLELLKRKLFPVNEWPPLLYGYGMKIAENCKGLPLTVAIVAGLLTTSKNEAWNEVLKSLRSGVISSTDQCESTIALSYRQLLDHLKPCFLSFGAFPEDYEVSAKRLIWFWIAEGFVRKSKSKSLEEVATDYLKSLISRSLVMQGKERSGGGVKACRIHDLLHEFCLRKANEENFFHLLKGNKELLSIDEPGDLRRLCIYSEPEHFKESRLFFPRLRSLFFFHPTEWDKKLDISFICLIFRLLRVLDIEKVSLTFYFPGEIRLLVQLRYLAIQATREVSPSIGDLCNLETFILRPVGQRVILPDTFWNLQRLRHMYLSDATGFSSIKLPVDNLDGSCNLLELDSLSTLYTHNWEIMEKQLRKFPNIRRLKCSLFEFGNNPTHISKVMTFSFLSQLESLNVSFHENFSQFEFSFPENIKKLTLHGCGLSWKGISSIAELPNLEVLKLLGESFIGDRWHVEEGEFSNLKFLKLESLDIVNWTASYYQFPYLQKLVLEYCHELEEIPECLENVENLEVIEVLNCPDCITSLVGKIEECQKDLGNSVLQVHVRSTN